MNAENTCTILLKGSQGKVIGLPTNMSQILSAMFCFPVKNSWFARKNRPGWDGTVHLYNRLTNAFDIGMLSEVVKALQQEGFTVSFDDKRGGDWSKLPSELYYKLPGGKELREYQRNAVDSVLKRQVAGVHFPCGVINIATNGGKTTIAASIIHNLQNCSRWLGSNDKVLFLTHSQEIATQTQRSLSEDLSQPIGFIGSGEWDDKPQICVAIIATLSHPNRAEQFKQLAEKCTVYIADEVHHGSADTWYKTMKEIQRAVVRVGLTGTVPKDDPLKANKLFGVTGTTSIRISNKFLIENGFSSTPVCRFITIDQPTDLQGISDFHEAYDFGVVDNEYRNDMILRTILYERLQGSNVLVMVERLAHGEHLLEQLNILMYAHGLHDVMGICEFTNGDKDKSFRRDVLDGLRESDVNVLIATSVLDEGVDVENINAIIYARGKKSPIKLLQGIGRGLRKKADNSQLYFYDFLDLTNAFLVKHSQERFKTTRAEEFRVEKFMPPPLPTK